MPMSHDDRMLQLTRMATQVLKNAVLRAALPEGQFPIDCSPERTAEVLEPWEPALLSDATQLYELLRLAFLEGQAVARGGLSVPSEPQTDRFVCEYS